MCRLLGISVNKDAPVDFSLKMFKSLGAKHASGWGLAYWDDHQKKIEWYKSELKTLIDENYDPKMRSIRTKALIAHVRLASDRDALGNTDARYSHPYYHKIADYHFVFAHNGGRGNKHVLLAESDAEFCPSNNRCCTDSEAAFAFLMTRLKRNVRGMNFENYVHVVEVLKKAIEEMESPSIGSTGNFNFLLMINDTIYARKDNLLNYTIRDPDRHEPTNRIIDEIIYGKSLRGEKAVLVSSQAQISSEMKNIHKDTGEHWKELESGTILVLRKGRLVYSTDQSMFQRGEVSNDYTPLLDFGEYLVLNVIKSSCHKISINDIIRISGIPEDRVLKYIEHLYELRYIKQNHSEELNLSRQAEYSTVKEKRREIDSFLKEM